MNSIGRSKFIIVSILFSLAGIAIFISMQLGAVYISPPTLFSFLQGKISEPNINLLVNLRTARVLSAFLSGCILSLSGLLYQTVFQNPLVDAYVLGVASGAVFGGMLSMRLGIMNPWPGAFAGAVMATTLTLILGKQNGGLSIIKTLLGGVVVGSVLSAASTFLLITWKGPLYGGIFWHLGNFANASRRGLIELGVVSFVFLLTFILFHRSLDILLLGEEEAASLGLRVGKFRLIVLVLSALAVSYISSRFGLLGFVGLIAPHVARLLVGPLHNLLLPTAFLFGGILLVSSETIARSVFAPVEIPVGIITVLLGGPFFLYLLGRRVGGK
ncbi:MAG: Hemin transport system permease protein HmuU [candidate division WS2 bacterium]|nr:Hemin transport system permease protein HmuU [Candidatus Lithacetigena glycinireducens]